MTVKLKSNLNVGPVKIFPNFWHCDIEHNTRGIPKNFIRPWWRPQMETFSALLVICAGNSPVTGEFPAQRPVTRSFDFSLICAWINGWVNNREAGDLRRHRAHYDVIVMRCAHLFHHHRTWSCCMNLISVASILQILSPTPWNHINKISSIAIKTKIWLQFIFFCMEKIHTTFSLLMFANNVALVMYIYPRSLYAKHHIDLIPASLKNTNDTFHQLSNDVPAVHCAKPYKRVR